VIKISTKAKKKKKKPVPYRYDAKIVRVIDGDTFEFEVDLGFSITIKEKLRLYGIDTPEIRGKERPQGLKVKKYVKKLIHNKMFEIDVYKKGKFGRYVADVYLKKGVTLTTHLLKKKMGRRVNY